MKKLRQISLPRHHLQKRIKGRAVGKTVSVTSLLPRRVRPPSIPIRRRLGFHRRLILHLNVLLLLCLALSPILLVRRLDLL